MLPITVLKLVILFRGFHVILCSFPLSEQSSSLQSNKREEGKEWMGEGKGEGCDSGKVSCGGKVERLRQWIGKFISVTAP